MSERVWRDIGSSVLGYGLMIGAIFGGQRRLLYFPDGLRRPEPSEADVPEMRAVELETADGLSLLAWHTPPREGGRPTLVYFHGNAGNIAMRAEKVRPYLDAGLGVLLTTWRGYTRNPGRPSEHGLYADGRAALSFLARNGARADGLVLYGESLGSGVAVQLASETPPAALVLEAPFSSIPDVAQARMPFVPVAPLIIDRFESRAKVAQVAAPLLLVHGERDRTVPVRFGRKLFAAATEPKEAVFIPGAGHGDLYEHGMGEIVLDFLRRRLGF